MKKLDEDVINQLIEIGRLEAIPSTFKPNNRWWENVHYFYRGGGAYDLSYEELKCLYKGVVLSEKESERYMGSTTNAAWVLNILVIRLEQSDNLEEVKELYEFGFANRGKNDYVPVGSRIYARCETYEDYQEVNYQKAINVAMHDEQMLREQKASKERKKFKAKSIKERAERKKERDKKLKRQNGLHTRYYDNGQILSKVHYKDGKLDGKWTFWYENGQKQLEANYKPYEVLAEDCRAKRSSPYIFPAKDSKDGKWTEWYENGQKKLEQNYKCGRVIGKWTT